MEKDANKLAGITRADSLYDRVDTKKEIKMTSPSPKAIDQDLNGKEHVEDINK